METLAPVDEFALYPIHEEDSLPETPAHYSQARYLSTALETCLPGCWVTGEICLYWIPENKRRYVAPDVVVIDGPKPDPLPPVYLAWRLPPIRFVVEVKSASTFQEDLGPKFERYERDLHAREYLYVDLDTRELRLWRLVEGRYEVVRPDVNGRLASTELGLSFGFDDLGLVRVFTSSGQRVPTHEEQQGLLHAEAERTRAEAERADAEAKRREEAEQQLAAALAELERLRGQSPSA
jgi:Uma2 family endonuclease